MHNLLRLFSSRVRVALYARPKIYCMNDLTRIVSTLPGANNRPIGGDQSRDGKQRAGIYAAIGAAAAIGGTAYLYKLYSEDKASSSGRMCEVPKAPEKEGGEGKTRHMIEFLPKAYALELTSTTRANQDLEKALKFAIKQALDASEAALTAYAEFRKPFEDYVESYLSGLTDKSTTLQGVISDQLLLDGCDTVIDICEKLKEIIPKFMHASEQRQRLREVIENGKACKYTKCNPQLLSAEKLLLSTEEKLRKANPEISYNFVINCETKSETA